VAIQFPFVRLARPFVALATAAALLAVLASAPASAAETKLFVGQKICRVPFVTIPAGQPGGYCLITEANIPFLEGAKAYYTDPHLVDGVSTSPVTIVATDERGSTITGHCTYYYPPAANPWHGLCVYSGGTGFFYGFNASWVIGSPTSTGVTVIGPYWFDRDHGNGDN
jgi:hypothetical protein